jgi:predicted O-methyltransferase YrrM
MENACRLKYALSPYAWTSLAARYAHIFALRVREFSGDIHLCPLSCADSLPEPVRGTLVELSSRESRRPSVFSEASAYGAAFQHERIRAVAEHCVKHYPGDIIEIGCYLGKTTKVLAQVAAAAGRRVIALDPWESGTQNCSGWEFQEFQKNIHEYGTHIDIIRSSSLLPEAISAVKARELCVAFVDGLHTYDAALTDIRTVSHCRGLIIVDDVSYSREVMMAMRAGAHEIGRRAVHIASAKEGYLVSSRSSEPSIPA